MQRTALLISLTALVLSTTAFTPASPTQINLPQQAGDSTVVPEAEGCCGGVGQGDDCGPQEFCEPGDLIPDGPLPSGNQIDVYTFSLLAGAQGRATGGFGCAAQAARDAESVRIISCTSDPDFANTVVVPGSFAATASYHSAGTDVRMRQVCYEVEVRYVDGRTPSSASGCSEEQVLVRTS